MRVHIPVKVRVVGNPDEETLELLARRVAAQVASRLAYARRELSAGRLGDLHREAHERYDPDRDAGAGYELPSYQSGGQSRQVPLRGRRPWLVLRAVNFRTTVGAFLDAVERQRDEELPARVLYDERAAEERWVAVWWVQVNVTTPLADVETVLNARARELSRLGPRQIVTDLVSPFDSAWEDLVRLDRTGQVRAQIPSPGVRNQRRVEGNGRDAVVSHGAWVVFAFMALPGISVEDVLDVRVLTQVRIPLPAAGFLVDQWEFLHRWGVGWDRFAEEFASEQVPVWLLGARLRKRVLAQAAYYLIGVAAEEQRSAATPSAAAGGGPQALIGEGLFVPTPEFLTAAPAAIGLYAHTVADPPAPSGVRAGHGVPLLPGWPVLFIHVEIPLGPDRVAAAVQGPTARRIAADMRVLMRAGIGLERWVFRMWDLLNEANAGGPPETRPPGGTLAEHVLAELERTGDFIRLYDLVDETRYFGLRAQLLAISLPTKFADHPRVRRLHEELAAARAATMRNEYLPAEGGGAILVDRDPDQRWSSGAVLGDLDSLYIVNRDAKRVKNSRLEALRAALSRHRVAVLGEVASGRLPREMDEESFAREVLARALQDVPIGKRDIEEVTIERSMKLLSVRRRDIAGLPSYDIRLVFVERIKGGRWEPVGNEVLETSGDFEARLIYWRLGKAGELYKTFGLAVTVVGVVLVAWEIGLIGLIVDAAGGAVAVAISITVSELIWLLKVAFTDERLTLRGFFLAALDGYLMVFGFRFGGLLGRWSATKIGTATLRRVIAGWIAERLVAGVVGGAVSAALERFAHDVIAVATGEGSWSRVGTYVKSMAFGAVVGAVAEFALQPALHALLAGGRTALESTGELVTRIRAEGWSAVQFSAGVTEALANLRASLTVLAGDAAGRGFATALAERLEVVIRELGSSAIAARVLELSGARFTRAATEGLQRFLRAAEAAGSQTRAHELARIFSQHPQETIYFLEALSMFETDAAKRLVAGTFGTRQELAAFLGRISHYEPAVQREAWRLLGELNLVAGDPVAATTAQEVHQQGLALSLRLQAEGHGVEAARLRAQAAEFRTEAEWRERLGDQRRADIRRRQAAELETQADAVDAKRAQFVATAAEVQAGRGPTVADIAPTDAEIDAALGALETGRTPNGGPQAWVRIEGKKGWGNEAVLARVVRSTFRSRSGNRVVFRVEGGTPPDASWHYTSIDANGNVKINTGDKAYNVNFGVFERAIEFFVANKRIGGQLKVFEVEERWFQTLRNAIGPEQATPAQLTITDPVTGAVSVRTAPKIKDVPDLPKLVDTRLAADQVQLPASMVGELQEFIVQGTGRVLEFTP